MGRQSSFVPGVKLDKELQLEKPYGVFFRNKDGSSGTSLVMGTIDKAPSDCEDLKTFYASQNMEIKNGFQNCRDTIVSQLSALNGHSNSRFARLLGMVACSRGERQFRKDSDCRRQ